MKNDGWEKAKKIFADAIKYAPGERVRFLDDVCGNDADIRREVESLLASYDEAESFMENPAVGEVAEIFVKEKLQNEPAKIFSDNQTPVTDEEELPETPDENALHPSRLRFALVCLLFAFMPAWLIINNYHWRSTSESLDTVIYDGTITREDYISKTEFSDKLREGDEIVSLSGIPIEEKSELLYAYNSLKPNEPFIMRILRGGQELEVELALPPLPLHLVLEYYLRCVLIPIVFLLVGLGVFLLKQNSKPALLLSVAFALSCIIIATKLWVSDLELPLILNILWQIGHEIRWLSLPVFLHLFLIFPERKRLLNRFPRLEWFVYLPYLIFVLPPFVLFKTFHPDDIAFAGVFMRVMVLNFPGKAILLISAWGTLILYIIAILTAVMSSYRQAFATNRRRIRLIVAGLIIASLPTFINVVLGSVDMLIGSRLLPSFIVKYPSLNRWYGLIFSVPITVVPLVFAYAIVQHRVIPISFVIRRGLQYLLAKNGLRLLLILPILGIVWNVAANPNRTLSEILFNNSFAFYSFAAVAAGFFLLIRLRFSDWIDRRFFREQYNQEKILRELTEAVKESDSLSKLSRLVSSRIQLALHPESIYLFFRDDAMNSDFSLGNTTNDASEKSANLKIAADSPLLHKMQQERGTIEFPTRQTDDLPNREKRWLRETGANLLVPMHGTDGRLVGFFSLGEKMSQIPYTTRDKELLETLANQIALVHENLGLKERMRREQRIKTEVLSRFDEGNINLLKECPKCGKCFDRNDEKCDADDSELTFSLPVERTIENRYRLEKLLGKGGMGAVYEATDLRINRRVAVKILSGAMFGNKEALRRFEREAQTAGKLNHPNIVTVFDYGVLATEGAFLVMELVEGETLTEVLRRKGRLDAEIVGAWFGQVLDGVEAAHKAGIIHRDLKPDNIFLTRNEDDTVRLCILDFGLARFNDLELAGGATVPGTVMGTLGYMPPEQLRGEKTDERSDLFATGVIIYEALYSEKPFAGRTYQEITQSMSKEIILDKREPFAEFFERGLAQNLEKRFATASEMKRNLSAITN